jgi:hypothetical protein
MNSKTLPNFGIRVQSASMTTFMAYPAVLHSAFSPHFGNQFCYLLYV